MASINWMKATTQKAGGMKKHLGQVQRENSNHSNEHINNALSHLNYAIGCSDYPAALNQMKARTKAVDKIMPPKRVRKDRVTCCFLELPCPRTITEQGKSDEFFKNAHEIYKNFFGAENVHGTFVHKDEVHEYIGKDGATHMSCEHSHTLISAYTEEKGINGKAFETRAKIKALNTLMDEMCVKEYGIHLNTGDTPQQKSVETLKMESDARQEASRIVSKAHEEAKSIQRDQMISKAEYEANKAYIRSFNETPDFFINNCTEAKIIEKGVLHKKKYVVVPIEIWEKRYITWQESDAVKEEQKAFRQTINSYYKVPPDKKIKDLEEKYKELKSKNTKLNSDLKNTEKFVNDVNNVLKSMSDDFQKIFWNTYSAYINSKEQRQQHSYEQEL